MDLQILTLEPITNRMLFKPANKKIVGIEKLIQICVLALYSSPGRDLIEEGWGGGLPDLIGQFNIDPGDLTEVFAEVSRRISKTETDVINSQIGLDLPVEERLRQIQVLSLRPGQEDGELEVTLRIVNELGRTRTVVV